MPTQLRALIVEDRPDDAELMLLELRRSGYDVSRWTVDTERDYLSALVAAPEVILCDYSMVQFNAMRALALMQDRGLDIPFLVVTGSICEEVAVNCMKQGAADYIIKDRLARLGPAVGQALKAKITRDAQRRAEAALVISEERFQRAVRAGGIGTWDWDLQTGHILWSEGYAELFGLKAVDFDGRYETFARHAHPEDLPSIEQALTWAREHHTPYDCEFRVIWPDSSEHWIHSTGQYIYDDNGRAVRISGVVRDITERRHADALMRQKEAQLRQAQKMEAVGALASGIAHDINNLLTVIFGSVANARRTHPEDETLANALDQTEAAAEQAANVTKGLLAFARQTALEKKTVDLRKVIDRVARLLKRMLPASIDLVIEKPDITPVWVHADETHLQQIVLNLAINARDAMPDGGTLRICVSQIPAAEAGPITMPTTETPACARLQVVDTGVGIPPKILDRIFDPFFTTKPRGQGTGLGLAITHSIVQEHGGNVSVTSTPGKGTTFTLAFPVAPPASGPRRDATAAADTQGRGECVLLVEDYEPVRKIVLATLRARGYEVITAADGDAAVQVFAQHQTRVRAVVLDVDLPKRSGLEVLRAIRDANRDVPAILITGKVEAGLEESLDPRSTLLRKPFRMADLASHLSEQLRSTSPCAVAP
ncbi:MAG: response regulator [Phycisphaerae bacterium]|jgi:PAS domain S-box-containing protein